jgi:heme/copper-type cytochrome/quinol oxidase subunit 4
MKVKLGISLFLALPFFVSAQGLSAQGFIASFLTFSSKVLIPFLLGIAFLFFVFNVIRFFVVGGGNEDSRENARNLATYGVLAFVIIVVFWGVVNLLSNSLGFGGANVPTPDYLQKNGVNFPTSNARPTTNNTNGTQSTNNGTANAVPQPVQCPSGATYNANSNTCDFQ